MEGYLPPILWIVKGLCRLIHFRAFHFLSRKIWEKKFGLRYHSVSKQSFDVPGKILPYTYGLRPGLRSRLSLGLRPGLRSKLWPRLGPRQVMLLVKILWILGLLSMPPSKQASRAGSPCREPPPPPVHPSPTPPPFGRISQASKQSLKRYLVSGTQCPAFQLTDQTSVQKC